MITHRGHPFARIDRIESWDQDEHISNLINRGVMTSPKNKLDVNEFLKEQLPKLPPEGTLVDAVIAEREEGF